MRAAKEVVQVAAIATSTAPSISVNVIAGIVAAAFGAGTIAGYIFSGRTKSLAVGKIGRVFHGALRNGKLVASVSRALKKYGYGKKSLVATSFCADEINRPLETALSKKFSSHFSMGGLAGFPFGGVAAFGVMASHIPDGGSCLVVFGPHVGVDSDGYVGTVSRRGRREGGPCCDSAIAASDYVTRVFKGKATKAGPPTDLKDEQQYNVGDLLLPYAGRLEAAAEKMVELPYALYEAQKSMMDDIVQAACHTVEGDGKIAVLGGIQINSPPECSDYFLPLSFELFDNRGQKEAVLLSSLRE